MRYQPFIILMLMLPLLLGYQNCSSPLFGGQSGGAPKGRVGNGTGYEGKPTYYRYFDPSQACSVANGEVLPNNVLLYTAANNVHLIRKDCVDITPQKLDETTITVEAGGKLQYAGIEFNRFEPSATAIAQTECPAGRTPLASPTRTNLLLDPVNLTSSNWGADFPGVTATLLGSFAGQPNFEITRINSGSQNFERLSQSTVLQASTLYAYSFMARPGTSNTLRFNAYRPGNDMVSVWDLTSGSNTFLGNGSLSDVSVTSRALSEGGFFFTIYFRTPGATASFDIGMSSDTLAQGDSVEVSGLQLETVDSFCAP